MSRLDTGEVFASGSEETLRFLFSCCSAVIAIVCWKGRIRAVELKARYFRDHDHGTN